MVLEAKTIQIVPVADEATAYRFLARYNTPAPKGWFYAPKLLIATHLYPEAGKTHGSRRATRRTTIGAYFKARAGAAGKWQRTNRLWNYRTHRYDYFEYEDLDDYLTRMEEHASNPDYQGDHNHELSRFYQENEEIYDALANGSDYDRDQHYFYELDAQDYLDLMDDSRYDNNPDDYAADNWLVKVGEYGKKQAKERDAANRPSFGDPESSKTIGSLSTAEVQDLVKAYPPNSLGIVLAEVVKNPNRTIITMKKRLDKNKAAAEAAKAKKAKTTDIEPQSALSHTEPKSPSFIASRTLALWAQLNNDTVEFICLLSVIRHGGSTSAFTVRHGLFPTGQARYFAALPDSVTIERAEQVTPHPERLARREERVYLKLLAAINDSCRFVIEPGSNESLRPRFKQHKFESGGFELPYLIGGIDPPRRFFTFASISHSDALDIWTCAPGTDFVYTQNIANHDVKTTLPPTHGLPPVSASYFKHRASTHGNAGVCGLAILNSQNEVVGWHAAGTSHNEQGFNWATYAHEAIDQISQAIKALPNQVPLNF
jgi:hypothetical protein